MRRVPADGSNSEESTLGLMSRGATSDRDDCSQDGLQQGKGDGSQSDIMLALIPETSVHPLVTSRSMPDGPDPFPGIGTRSREISADDWLGDRSCNSLQRLDYLRRTTSNRSDNGVRSMIASDVKEASKVQAPLSTIASGSVASDSVDGATVSVSMTTILSGISLCANTVVGAGTLATPFTMNLVGFALYHVLIVVVLVGTSVSLRWLVEVADALPDDVPRSYEGIAHHYLGGEADAAFSIALLFGGFALTMAYMLFITTSLASVAAGVLEQWMSADCAKNAVLFGVGLGVVLPLLLLRDISKLRYTAAFAICALFGTAAYVVVSGWMYVAQEGIHTGFVPVRLSSGVFEAIPMCVSAYSCHILVIPIYDSLGPGRSRELMYKVLFASLTLASIIYEVVGIMGYMHFGGQVHGNILESLDREYVGSPIIGIVSIGMALTLICHLPCIVWPLRSCIISSYHYLVVGYEHMKDEPTVAEWSVTSLSIMVGVLTMVTLFPNVKTALAIVGSVGGAFIVFLYPAAFHLTVVRQLPPGRAWLARENAAELVMMSIGTCLGVFGLTKSIIGSLTS